MLNVTIKSVRDATECDKCTESYKQQYGCKIGCGTMEVVACRIEHARRNVNGSR